jgi:hypothetical protein
MLPRSTIGFIRSVTLCSFCKLPSIFGLLFPAVAQYAKGNNYEVGAMNVLKLLESKLGEFFKGVPNLPENARRSLADFYPWLALIFGVLQILAVMALWQLGHNVNELSDAILKVYKGNAVPSLGMFYWLSLAVLVIDAVILLMAFPQLRARRKKGWDLLFLATALNIVYGFVFMLVDNYYGGNFGDFLRSVFFSVIGFYLLYQVRSYYAGSSSAK